MKWADRIIAVTGATGFLGGHIVTALLARGARTVAVVRNPEKAAPLAARGVEIRKADLSDEDALAAAFAGVDAVVHNAAVVAFTRPRETMQTNAEGTRHVFRAMGRAGVHRAIALSSTTAYPMTFRTLSETAPLRAGNARAIFSAYGESKARAEHIASELSREHGIALTILRPCGITGPSDPLFAPALARVSRSPVTLLPVFSVIGVVHAADVADAICNALERDESAGKAYNLQGHTVSLWDFARAWMRAAGKRPRLCLPIPVPVSLRYDDSRARKELGFSPRSLEAIVAEAVAHSAG